MHRVLSRLRLQRFTVRHFWTRAEVRRSLRFNLAGYNTLTLVDAVGCCGCCSNPPLKNESVPRAAHGNMESCLDERRRVLTRRLRVCLLLFLCVAFTPSWASSASLARTSGSFLYRRSFLYAGLLSHPHATHTLSFSKTPFRGFHGKNSFVRASLDFFVPMPTGFSTSEGGAFEKIFCHILDQRFTGRATADGGIGTSAVPVAIFLAGHVASGQITAHLLLRCVCPSSWVSSRPTPLFSSGSAPWPTAPPFAPYHCCCRRCRSWAISPLLLRLAGDALSL